MNRKPNLQKIKTKHFNKSIFSKRQEGKILEKISNNKKDNRQMILKENYIIIIIYVISDYSNPNFKMKLNVNACNKALLKIKRT